MILSFHFEYISKNSVLDNFISNSLKNTSLKYSLVKEPDVLKLFVEGEDDALMELSNSLSTTLPISIYFKSLHVEVVEELPESNFAPRDCKIVLPFTPLMSMDKSFDPFITPDVGKAVNATANIYFKGESSSELGFEQIFQKCAKDLANGERVYIKTFGGEFSCVVLKNSKVSLKKDAIIVATDLSTVQKMVIAQESEIKALASLEKPILNLPTNTIFDSKELLDEKFVNIALSNDMISHPLCVELFKLGDRKSVV